MKILNVDLGARSYDILIGKNILSEAGKYIREVSPAKRAIIVTDEHVAALYLPSVEASLQQQGYRVNPIVIAPGEGSKSFAMLEHLLEVMLALKPDRKTLVVALGGGVVGDLTGFAASIVLRGIDFVQIPTSLLAQVDSSVGGKTGINSRHGKNLVGSFYQPRLVLVDTSSLRTLPKRELAAGYAEIMKCAAIADEHFFAWLEDYGNDVLAGEPKALEHAIAIACALKARIVAEDERESGRRALLNFGHTFGHALEAELGYDGRLLHGEAVAIGMIMAAELSFELGLCAASDVSRLHSHLVMRGLPVTLPPELKGTAPEKILRHMQSDKKTVEGKLTFILLHRIGDATIKSDVPEEAVLKILTAMM